MFVFQKKDKDQEITLPEHLTKEERKQVKEIIRKAKNIALNESMPVLERLTKTVLAANVDTKTGDMILEQVHKPQNALMHAKMLEKLLSQLVPLFVKIIEDGISQNLMQTDYPEDTIQMLLLYSNSAFDDNIS